MEIQKIEGILEEDKWNSEISRFPGKTVYHTYEWLEFIERTQGLKKVIYEIKMNGEVVGYLAGFTIRKGPIKIFASPFPGWTTAYMGPVLDKTVPQRLFFTEFKRLMKREGYHYAELSNRILDEKIAKEEDFIVEQGITYIAEVKSNPDEILASYSESPRYYARKAAKNDDLLVETTTDESFVDHYYAQLQEVFLKSEMKPTYSKDRVKLLIETLLPRGRLLLTWVKYKEQVVACYIDVIDEQWMYSFGCVSSRDYLKLHPNELARFHAMCTAAEKGVEYYDMTGGGTYKARFGGEETVVYRIIYSRFGLYKARNIAKELIRFKNRA